MDLNHSARAKEKYFFTIKMRSLWRISPNIKLLQTTVEIKGSDIQHT